MTAWTRAYLLTLYETAITKGYAEVSGLTEAQAKSLRQSFYRLRRRSDSSNASFITPAHYLVTVMDFQPISNGLGSLRFSYSDPGLSLPPITAPDGSTVPLVTEALSSEQPLTPAAEIISSTPDPLASFTDAGLAIPIEASDLVAQLRRSAAARRGEELPDD